MKQIVVTIPIPPQACNPNRSHVHWRTRHAAAKRAREDAMLCALEASDSERPGWSEAVCHIRWFGKTRSCLRLDRDNIIAATKPSRDGLTDAGIWVDDRHVRIGEVTREVDKANPRVELVVERSEA